MAETQTKHPRGFSAFDELYDIIKKNFEEELDNEIILKKIRNDIARHERVYVGFNVDRLFHRILERCNDQTEIALTKAHAQWRMTNSRLELMEDEVCYAHNCAREAEERKKLKACDTIVFVGIPNPDNIFMIVQQIIRSTSKIPRQHVGIVLSPHIVDLRAPRPGKNFEGLREATNLPDDEVKRDTKIYVLLSAFRIAETLQDLGIDRERYTIFWDENSLETMKTPDMRHAFHHDFKYNFNDKEMATYYQIMENNPEGGVELRYRLRVVMREYMARRRSELGLHGPTIGYMEEALYSLESLLNTNKRVKNVTFVISGPFTEALRCLEGLPAPQLITAMAGGILHDGVQFNFWKDMPTAIKFLEHVQKQRLELHLIPTKCVKGSQEAPCPFEMSVSEYGKALGEESPLFRMIQRHVKDRGGLDSYAAFDWVAAVASYKPSIFTWRTVNFTVIEQGQNISFTRVPVNSTTIKMACKNYDHMNNKKGKLFEEMRKVGVTNPRVGKL